MPTRVGLTQISLAVKSSDSDNPLFGERMLVISHIY